MQVFAQVIILYILKGPTATSIDISSLVYDQSSIFSKASYALLLISSISSVCIDLAKILKWGYKPVITTYISFTFFKIFLFILTKFVVQSYVLSMAVKSLMYQFTILPSLVSDKDSDELNGLLQLYYRGIYKSPQLITFNQATLYAPLLILALLFVPSIVCAFVFSVWNTGLKSWSENFVRQIVLLLFATVTNMSYSSARTSSVSKSEELNDQENPTAETQVDLGIFYSNHLEVVHAFRSTPPPLIKNPAMAKKNLQRLGIV